METGVERDRPHGADDAAALLLNGIPAFRLSHGEAEAAALGSMMLSAEAIADAVEILRADDFNRRPTAPLRGAPRAGRLAAAC